MSRAEIWHQAMRVLGAYSALTYWYTTGSEPECCWAIDASDDDIREDRVVGSVNPDDPLYYHSIKSAVVTREHSRHPGEIERPFSADRWERLTHELRGVPGLSLVPLRDFEVWGFPPVNEAVKLTVTSPGSGGSAA